MEMEFLIELLAMLVAAIVGGVAVWKWNGRKGSIQLTLEKQLKKTSDQVAQLEVEAYLRDELKDLRDRRDQLRPVRTRTRSTPAAPTPATPTPAAPTP